MGEVCVCSEIDSGNLIALKTIQERFFADLSHRRLFEKEATVWVSLGRHPNIVHAYDFGHFNGAPLLFMEFVAGSKEDCDLRAELIHGPLPPDTALNYAIQVCTALTHAQKHFPGLVHRDIKPENILIIRAGVAKLTDLGLTRVVDDIMFSLPLLHRRRDCLATWDEDGAHTELGRFTALHVS